MAESTIWWLFAGAAVAVELLTGTFYLIMLAIGLVAAAVVAHLGASAAVQLLVAAGVGGGAVGAWHIRQSKRGAMPAATANRDVNLDIGEVVHVDVWNTDGTALVKYRGANWTVMHRNGSPQSTGAHRIVEVIGSRLLLDKI